LRTKAWCRSATAPEVRADHAGQASPPVRVPVRRRSRGPRRSAARPRQPRTAFARFQRRQCARSMPAFAAFSLSGRLSVSFASPRAVRQQGLVHVVLRHWTCHAARSGRGRSGSMAMNSRAVSVGIGEIDTRSGIQAARWAHPPACHRRQRRKTGGRAACPPSDHVVRATSMQCQAHLARANCRADQRQHRLVRGGHPEERDLASGITCASGKCSTSR